MAERSNDDLAQRERSRLTASDVLWAVRDLKRAQAELDLALAARLALRALDWTAMTHVLTADPPLGPVELAGRLGISSGSGTELADRLQRAGHLHRRRDDDDRRRVVLEPEAASVSRMLEELTPLVDDLEHLVATFSPTEQDVIRRYLTATAERLHTWADTLGAS